MSCELDIPEILPTAFYALAAQRRGHWGERPQPLDSFSQ